MKYFAHASSTPISRDSNAASSIFNSSAVSRFTSSIARMASSLSPAPPLFGGMHPS